MTFTQPCNTSTTNDDPLVKTIQREVDNGQKPNVPFIYRRKLIAHHVVGNGITHLRQERKIEVLACLPKQGEITLGGNHDPDKKPVDVELRCKTHKGEPIHISHHACTIERIDNESNDEVRFMIKGSATQEECEPLDKPGSKFYVSHDEWEGRKKSSIYIQRLAKGRQFSAVATKYSSTCIQVSHDQEIMDQIFLCIPPNWNPLFPVSQYSSRAENWYWVPTPCKLGESFPPPPAVAAEQVASNHAALPPTQESVKSLLPSGTLHLSKGKNYRNMRGQDPVGMFHQVLPSLINSDADDTQAPSQGADTEIFKFMDLPPVAASKDPKAEVRNRGSIFECAAKYLSLKVIQRYQYDIGHVLRQSWANSSSSCPIYDLRGLIVEYDEDGGRGCDSAYFVGGPTMTSEDARSLALGLAPDYRHEFTALFGNKEAYEAEMKSLENDEKYISVILPTVLARVLLCPIILHLSDGGKPIYFYPYPIKGGVALPQFGDYSRPPMRLTLWSNAQYSLLMPINYSDEFVDNSLSPLLKVDGGNCKVEDGKDAEVKKKQKSDDKNFTLTVRFKKYKNKVKKDDDAILGVPGITLYAGRDKKEYDAARKFVEPLRELIETNYPLDELEDGKFYKISDWNKLAHGAGYFKHRQIIAAAKSASSDVDDPLVFLCYGKGVQKGHYILKDEHEHNMVVRDRNTNNARMAANVVRSYRNKSVTCVQELAKNKLKLQIKSSSLTGFFESHTADFPTMEHALGNVNLYHATAVSASNGEWLPYDDQYIKCIPKANGPYAHSNSGDQISGKDWLEKLPPDMRDKVEDLHGQYCILPTWMLPMSALAVTSHMRLKDIHSSRVYSGKDPVEAILFHRFKSFRGNYIPMRRHTVALIPRQLSIDWKFFPVGDNSQGCDLLAKSSYPVPVTELAEMTFEDEKTFVVESGCDVKRVIANGDYCKPNRSVKFKVGDKLERHNEMVREILMECKSKTKESSKSAEEQPAKAKKQNDKSSKSKEQSNSTSEKRGASLSKTKAASRKNADSADDDSDDIPPPKKSRTTTAKKPAKSRKKVDSSDDEFSEEEIPKPKKRAPAKKAATSRKKKRQDDTDSDDDIQYMGTQSSKAPARATASRARSTATKPKYNYDDDDDDDDDDFVEEPPATKLRGRATASRARSTAKKPKYNYDDDDDEIMDDDDFVVEETPVEKPKGRGATKSKAKTASKPAGRGRAGRVNLYNDSDSDDYQPQTGGWGVAKSQASRRR